jgi:glycosyltransferase involved in cell wall biosynthesis
MTSAVAISVVVPCFNSAAFLAETVDSLVAQTTEAMEVIFVDDGSEDGTAAMLARILALHADRRMRVVSQPNAGVAAARNRGIALAEGRYILPLDADDRLAPTMLARAAAVLDARPEIAIVFTDRQDFGALTGRHPGGRFELDRLKYFNQLSYCALYRREVWMAIGGYRPNVSGFDDWDFWLAAAARGFIAHHIPEPLVLHRRHSTSQLGAVMPHYERLFATIILNNREVYAPSEVAAATAFLERGTPAALLSAGRMIFTGRYPLPARDEV